MRLPTFWNPDKGKWFFGFWCSGPESLCGDGLLCYHNLEGLPETIREKDLVKECSNPISAFLKWVKKTKVLRRLVDYLLDTLITNLTIMAIVVPYYIATGMPWESVKLVIFAFFTIGWVEAFPIPIILRWFRRKVKYLEVK